MNHKYRKKPVVIEAFHWCNDSRQDPAAWPPWLLDASEMSPAQIGSFWENREGCRFGVNPHYEIHTLEGNHVVSENDWIIQGVQGELYPCKPDIFAATYDAVESESE